jgi:hypothetical protein
MTLTPKYVLALCHRFQMIWIDTAKIAAKMVDRQPFRDRTDGDLPSHTMR